MDRSWYCVHIPRSRVFTATNRTFVGLLRGEPRHPDIECPVYGQAATDDDGYCYYFSPQAGFHYRIFVRFWGGVECAEPPDVNVMSRVI